MTQIRPHAGSYQESMRRAVNVHVAEDVLAYIYCHYPQWRPDLKHMVQMRCGFDTRNGWDTWIVRLRNQPAIWSDGPIDGIAKLEIIQTGSG